MKSLHKFTVKNGDKDEQFEIMSPTRAISKESEMIYAKTYGSCIRAGLLSNVEAAKLSSERGGVWSEEEKEEYAKLLTEFFVKEKEVNTAKSEKTGEVTSEVAGEVVPEAETDKGKKKRKHKETTAEIELKNLKDKIITLQSRQDAIFAQTADTKAREESILYYTVYLTYKDGKPFFEGKNFEDKVNKLDNAAPDDTFLSKVFKKALWYVTATNYGILNFDDFQFPED